MFYRNANAALLVFDITSWASFESMQGWVQELKKNVEEPMVLVVVGNKTDLLDKRKVHIYLKICVKSKKELRICQLYSDMFATRV